MISLHTEIRQEYHDWLKLSTVNTRNEWGKEMNGAPKRTTRLICANAGSPTGRESYGDGTPVVATARN